MATACARAFNVPGPRGQKGDNGINGTNGANAFSHLLSGFTMPAAASTVTVEVADTSWMIPSDDIGGAGEVDGQVIVVEFAGSFLATGIVDATHVILYNLGYPGNAAAGIVIPPNAGVSPGGLRGESGSVPGGALLAVNNLGDLIDPAEAISNLGLGALATLNVVTDALFSGVLSLAKGGTGATDAAGARAALGILGMGLQAANSVAITGGTVSVTSVTAATGTITNLTVTTSLTLNGPFYVAQSSIQSVLAATAISPNAPTVKVAGNGGAVVLTATPTISTPSAAQRLTIQGTNDTNTVTLQDETSLAGTKLKLGASTRVLAKGDSIVLEFDSIDGFWYERGFTTIV